MKENIREYEKAILFVKQQIEQGNLQIGSRLPTERVISETLGISRNSTREALRIMENMGVTESRQGSGNYLSENLSEKVSLMIDMMLIMKKTTLSQISEFRRSMEKTVCDMLITQVENDDIILNIKDSINTFMDTTLDNQIELDKKFHYFLICATDNNFLIMLMNAVSDIYRKSIDIILKNASVETKSEIHKYHNLILDSLIFKNRGLCMMAIDAHYDLIEKEQKRQNIGWK